MIICENEVRKLLEIDTIEHKKLQRETLNFSLKD